MTELQLASISIAAYAVSAWVLWIVGEWRARKRMEEKLVRQERARRRVEERIEERSSHAL